MAMYSFKNKKILIAILYNAQGTVLIKIHIYALNTYYVLATYDFVGINKILIITTGGGLPHVIGEEILMAKHQNDGIQTHKSVSRTHLVMCQGQAFLISSPQNHN